MTVSVEHFTATLTISQTVKSSTPGPATYDRRVQAEPVASRDVTEVARLVIRGSDMDDLRAKIAAHAALL